jgi:hypothetical protein
MLQLWILAKQLVRWNFHCRSQPFHRRDFRVALSPLDPADLGGMNATACGDLLLG